MLQILGTSKCKQPSEPKCTQQSANLHANVSSYPLIFLSLSLCNTCNLSELLISCLTPSHLNYHSLQFYLTPIIIQCSIQLAATEHVADVLPSAMKSSLIFEASKLSRNAPANGKVSGKVHIQCHCANVQFTQQSHSKNIITLNKKVITIQLRQKCQKYYTVAVLDQLKP